MLARVIDPLTHLNAIRFAFWFYSDSILSVILWCPRIFHPFLPLILSFRWQADSRSVFFLPRWSYLSIFFSFTRSLILYQLSINPPLVGGRRDNGEGIIVWWFESIFILKGLNTSIHSIVLIILIFYYFYIQQLRLYTNSINIIFREEILGLIETNLLLLSAKHQLVFLLFGFDRW